MGCFILDCGDNGFCFMECDLKCLLLGYW